MKIQNKMYCIFLLSDLKKNVLLLTMITIYGLQPFWSNEEMHTKTEDYSALLCIFTIFVFLSLDIYQYFFFAIETILFQKVVLLHRLQSSYCLLATTAK